MADVQTNQPSRAEDYRKTATTFAEEIAQISTVPTPIDISLRYATLAMWAIAAELAEANARDREAEIRAKNSEGFVAGIQAELNRQGVIIPGGVAQVKPPRGR